MLCLSMDLSVCWWPWTKDNLVMEIFFFVAMSNHHLLHRLNLVKLLEINDHCWSIMSQYFFTSRRKPYIYITHPSPKISRNVMEDFRRSRMLYSLLWTETLPFIHSRKACKTEETQEGTDHTFLPCRLK